MDRFEPGCVSTNTGPGLDPEVLTSSVEQVGSFMIIGAAIAGLLIVSLLLETVTSQPKSEEQPSSDAERVK
jgi:hypothetical protein